MSGNIALLIFSLIFIAIIIIYLSKRWPELDIIDLYIIFVGLHFGLYPFIRSLHFGPDVVFDFRSASPWPLGLVFVQLLACLVIIRSVSLCFPKEFLKLLNIKYLLQQCSSINKYILFIFYICLIAFQIFSYYEFGIITYIMPADFAKIGKSLPYWFTSVRTIYNLLAFFVFFGLFANLVTARKYRRLAWIILTIIFALIATIYGRRYFIEMLITSVIFWFAYAKINLFRWRVLAVAGGLLGVFFIFSNVYQGYRGVIQNVGQINSQKLANPLHAALNFRATLSNLAQRPGTWEFDFLVINNQLHKSGMTMQGKVFWEGFKSAIPRFFWPSKQFSLIDDMLAALYAVNPKSIDIGKNLFGLAQIDFGYFSIILVPAIILIIIISLGYLVKLTVNYPTFLTLFTANIVFYLINIEENGNELFFMFRNILIIGVLFMIYLLAHNAFLKFIPVKPLHDSPNNHPVG